MIALDIIAGDGLEYSDIDDVTVKLVGTNTKASYNLTNDVISSLSDIADIEMQTTISGISDITSQAIVIPQTLSGAKLTFEPAAHGTFEVALKTAAFEIGKQYQYKVILNRTGVTLSAPNIGSWGDGAEVDDDLDAVIPPPPVNYSDLANVNKLLGRSDSELNYQTAT